MCVFCPVGAEMRGEEEEEGETRAKEVGGRE